MNDERELIEFEQFIDCFPHTNEFCLWRGGLLTKEVLSNKIDKKELLILLMKHYSSFDKETLIIWIEIDDKKFAILIYIDIINFDNRLFIKHTDLVDKALEKYGE